MVNFSLRSDCFGLTYADAKNTEKHLVFEHLCELVLKDAKTTDVMLCEEVGHKTGKRHYHAYVKFEKRLTIHEFDFDCYGLHASIKRVKRDSKKTIKPMILYLTKEDQFPYSTFDWNQYIIPDEEKKSNKRTSPDWDLYLEEGLFVDEVPKRLRADGWSASFANRFFNWSGFIKATFPSRDKEVYKPNPSYKFLLPSALCLWKACCFDVWIEAMKRGDPWYRPRNLVLIGPTRSGKTEWARSLGKHMYFNNLLNLDDWDESADYIILDDFTSDILKYLPCWKCFFGSQKEFTLTDKYRGKKTVRWGKPMIWLSNEDIFKNLNIEHINFIKGNADVIVLDSKLY